MQFKAIATPVIYIFWAPGMIQWLQHNAQLPTQSLLCESSPINR